MIMISKKNCVKKYEEYVKCTNINVFYDKDDSKQTFEIVLYLDNKALCDSLYGSDAQNYMLKNKTEAAYKLLSQEQPIAVPDYIKKAIEWIRE